MKNVLIITGNTKPNSGIGRYSLSIIEQLRGMGVDYTVLTEQGKYSGGEDEKSVLHPKSSIVNLVRNFFLVRKEL